MQRAEPPKNVLVSDGAIHSRMRKTLTQCFSTQTLKDSESTIIHYADLLIAKLHEESKTGPCDLAAYYNFATFDILADLAFGHPFGVLARGQYNTFMSRLFSNLWVVSILVGISLTPGLSSTFAFLVRNLNIGHQARTKFKQTVKDVVMKRQAEDTDRKDFLGHMMAFTGEKGLSQIELESNAEILIVAGSETSATALAGITFHLLQDRQCLERLQQEVRARFKSSAEIGPSTALQLPYLKAVFEESMRIYPSAPGGMPRTLQGDTIIDGVVISAGTNVSVANYVSNHSEMNYKDPDKFVPQRWLGLEGYEEDKLTTFHPFSLGPKNCIGRR
jgi:cytochrome P450